MSSARWDPFRGQFGYLGSWGSTQEGKLRQWMATPEGGMGKPSEIVKTTVGIPKGRPGTRIPGLGHERYRSDPGAGFGMNILQQGKFHATPWEFGKAYVNPKIQHLTKDPLSEMATIRDYGSAADPTKAYAFSRLSEEFIPEGVSPSEAIVADDYDIAGDMQLAEEAKVEAKDAYDYDVEQSDIAIEVAEEARDLAKKEFAKGRILTTEKAVPEYQRAEAVKAATGMAYSAPAERTAGQGMHDIEKQLTQLQTKDFQSEREMKDEIDRIEAERYGHGGIEDRWLTAQKDYERSLMDASALAEEGIGVIDDKLGQMWSAYETGYDQPGLTNLGYFGKSKADIGEFGEVEAIAEKAKIFASNLGADAESRLSLLSQEG